MLTSEHFYIKFQIFCFTVGKWCQSLCQTPISSFISKTCFSVSFFPPNGILNLYLPIGHNHTGSHHSQHLYRTSICLIANLAEIGPIKFPVIIKSLLFFHPKKKKLGKYQCQFFRLRIKNGTEISACKPK